MSTDDHMWRTQWHEDMSQIARALDLDPEKIPEGDGLDAILAALARVKRDAAREALDGLAEWHDREAANSGAGSHYWDASNRVATSARHHRDTHYPKETPWR